MKNYSISIIATSLAIATTACQPETPPVATIPSPTSSATPSVQNETINFNEELYSFANPDAAELIKKGEYKSGLEHYTTIGKNTKKPDGEDYETFYTGTKGNDTVQGLGYGKHAHFIGVSLELVKDKKVDFPLRPESLGKGEVDVLVGNKGGGGNEFLLGSFMTPVNPKAEAFYVGKGDADYARIQNFTKSKDVIILSGELSQYKLTPKEGNLQISTADGDLVAIVEGVDKLELGDVVKDLGIFTLK